MTPLKFFLLAVSLIVLWAIIDSIRSNYRRRRYDRSTRAKHNKDIGGIGDAGNTAAGGAMLGAPFMFHGQSDTSNENQYIDPGTSNNPGDWGPGSTYDSGGYDSGGDGGGGDGGGGD
jgi:hypothetical protein